MAKFEAELCVELDCFIIAHITYMDKVDEHHACVIVFEVHAYLMYNLTLKYCLVCHFAYYMYFWFNQKKGDSNLKDKAQL